MKRQGILFIILYFEHSSARYYIMGKHAAYEVVDAEEVISKLTQGRAE